VPTLSPKLEAAVLRALAKDPQARYASVRAFAQTLTEAWQEEGILEMISPGVRKTALFVPPGARITPRLLSPPATILETAQEASTEVLLLDQRADEGTFERPGGTTASDGAARLGGTGRAVGAGNAARPPRAGKRAERMTVLAACLGVLAIAILVISGLVFQGGSPNSSLAHAGDTGMGRQESTPTPVGRSPVPTARPTTSLSPSPAVPSPTTPVPSPTPGGAAFFISPTTSAQTCSSSATNLPGIHVTLDNTGGLAPVTWQVQITQVDASGALWASGMPKNGTVAAGKTAQVLVKPEKSLCQLHPTTTFQATITYQTTSGSGTILFSDVVSS
jgi:hypothetical protein